MGGSFRAVSDRGKVFLAGDDHRKSRIKNKKPVGEYLSNGFFIKNDKNGLFLKSLSSDEAHAE